jgi:hypothetical protein
VVGHTSGETIWKHFAHTFDGARGGAPVPMETAVRNAQARIARSGIRTVYAQDNVIELFPDRTADEVAAYERHFQARAAGFEPATFGSGG